MRARGNRSTRSIHTTKRFETYQRISIKICNSSHAFIMDILKKIRNVRNSWEKRGYNSILHKNLRRKRFLIQSVCISLSFECCKRDTHVAKPGTRNSDHRFFVVFDEENYEAPLDTLSSNRGKTCNSPSPFISFPCWSNDLWALAANDRARERRVHIALHALKCGCTVGVAQIVHDCCIVFVDARLRSSSQCLARSKVSQRKDIERKRKKLIELSIFLPINL